MSSVLSRKYGQTEIGNRQVIFNSKVSTKLLWRTQDRYPHHTHKINADVNGALNNMGKSNIHYMGNKKLLLKAYKKAEIAGIAHANALGNLGKIASEILGFEVIAADFPDCISEGKLRRCG